MKIVGIECPFCKSITKVNLTDEEYNKLSLLKDRCIQDVFPQWSVEKRELFITEICDECRKKVFD